MSAGYAYPGGARTRWGGRPGLAATEGVDVVGHPDSNEIAGAVGSGPDPKRFIVREDARPDYFDGEPDA